MKAPLRFDAAQRFTCGRCLRCCHFDVPLTLEEAAGLRAPEIAGLWSAIAGPGGSEGSRDEEARTRDPLEPAAGGLLKIRRRDDGACGFLAADGACRIHAERGAEAKPLACRLFPFRPHPGEGPTLVTASFSCPTVARNEGTPLAEQHPALARLVKQWMRAFPEEPAPLRFDGTRPFSGGLAGEIRSLFLGLLERRAPGGEADLRANVALVAALLEDWTRLRVRQLADPEFAEYVRLTGRHAAATGKVPSPDSRGRPRAPKATALGRLLRRGFLLAVVAARLQGRGPQRGPRLGLRVRLAAVALHLNGLWPKVAGIDRGAVRRVRFDLAEPGIGEVVRHYLRSTFETLPTGGRPLVDEVAWAFATLDAARSLAAMRAAAEGRDAVAGGDLVAGLAEAADLSLAERRGFRGALLGPLTGGLDALRAFAETPAGGGR